jgi:DNA-binding transcriptional ArsR family regulator
MDVPGGREGSVADDAAARHEVVVEWLANLDPGSERWESDLAPVTLTVVDALLHADAETLQEIADPLRDALAGLFAADGHAREIRGYLLGALASVRLGLQRLPDPTDIELAADSHAGAMLKALETGAPLTSSELRDRLETSDSQLSRVGRNLLARGLVVQRRAGRRAIWELSPRGRQVLGGARGRNRRTVR